ncbi:urease accessory protein UreD [Cyanobium sp. CH-040]|uniref:urease accessory protein UreD n=1 Tax=Cyanobium sp. CH-040 TaxID=2823708 RepID=UPI0020CC06D6|nr:urease accessory protein UreD [Cyanobium sp. CH-040]MCP9928393.1 urease accessory protein UreD [Cyanobium sp. CH-040]
MCLAALPANPDGPPTPGPPLPPPETSAGWQARAWLRLESEPGRYRAGATAPLKWQRAYAAGEGRLQLPLLHTAGGLVGGDGLTVEVEGAPGSRGLLTTVAAQKVYGSVGRFRRRGAGRRWATQTLCMRLEAGADLEWLPQELVLYADGLYGQHCRVELAPGASWLGAELVRLGRSAAGEGLGAGCWRSALEVVRLGPGGERWELVDRLSLEGEALASAHGMDGQPVLGTLVWAAPDGLPAQRLAELAAEARAARAGLEGEMAVGCLEQGLIARYRGGSSQAARYWFTRLWALSRAARGLARPQLPRVWPFQETPWLPQGSP